MIQPPQLAPGNTIGILCPAGAIPLEKVTICAQVLESWGYQVRIGKTVGTQFGHFAASDLDRQNELQSMMDDPEIHAILCARGGYGLSRIIGALNFSKFNAHPKWVVGFSDITVFHHRLIKLGVQCIHGTMPLNFETNTVEAIDTLLHNLSKAPVDFNLAANDFNKEGAATGILLGGNLSIVHSMLGTDDQFNFEDAILFIEDLGEHLYQIDRMIFALKKSGALHKIKGLIIGGMSDLEDTDPPFGHAINSIIKSQFEFSKIPLLFDFPAGHISDNRALIFGKRVSLEVGKENSRLHYLN
jgi:muramoyltetrapeptide carboxypeptidase